MPASARGATLLELLVTMIVLGVVVSTVGWTAARWSNRARVDAAAGVLLDAYRRTQSVARAWGRPAELVVTGDSLVIRAVWLSESTEVWRAPGPVQSGVSLTPPLHVAAYLPSGLAAGPANVSHVLQRGTVRRQVIVSRLGRVRVVP